MWITGLTRSDFDTSSNVWAATLRGLRVSACAPLKTTYTSQIWRAPSFPSPTFLDFLLERHWSTPRILRCTGIICRFWFWSSRLSLEEISSCKFYTRTKMLQLEWYLSVWREIMCECKTGTRALKPVNTRSWFRAKLCCVFFASLCFKRHHQPPCSHLPGLWPTVAQRHLVEDDKEQGRTCLPICHVFLRVCAAATFDEWEERLGHLYPFSVTLSTRAVKTRGGERR